MLRWKHLAFTALVALAIGAAGPPSLAESAYSINGRPAPAAWQAYMASNGLPPGDYWLAEDGSWGVMGSARPRGNIYSGASFAGSGDEQGCISAPDGSNC
jgi:hypothetical protein